MGYKYVIENQATGEVRTSMKVYDSIDELQQDRQKRLNELRADGDFKKDDVVFLSIKQVEDTKQTMKLKRFVLLNSNMIYDLVVERDVEKFNMVKNSNALHYQVKQTSDNILDLVEVGDLAEPVYPVIKYPHYIKGVTELGNYLVGHKEAFKQNEIIAIYKRQPNGDYKKYEVK